MGSNMAENHPVGFQWVVEARERGAHVIHVDPRFTRTSAMATRWVGIRAGSDIAFLGGIVNYILENERYFRDYVVNYTNAPVILNEDYQDTEDLDGLFSGWDPEKKKYSNTTWQYAGMQVHGAAGQREEGFERTKGHGAGHGGHGAALSHGEPPEEDMSLTHPRCVFQVLKRHFARYTPAFVADACGCTEREFLAVAEALCENSGRERTGAFVYSVGWTQHTVGVQYIRTAAIIQLLLGNMGRPGGGIVALRGHASIQGSTDIPTLYDILPGYITMPHVGHYRDLAEYIDVNTSAAGWWGNFDAYIVSLLKAWWGPKATEENEFYFDSLPRIDQDNSIYKCVLDMLDGGVEGMIVAGENPAVGSSHSKLHRLAMAKLKWLVVRDLVEIETASFWKDGPEIETGELLTDEIATEVFFLPASAHVEKDGSFTNTQRLLQWHFKAVEPKKDCRSDLWFYYHLGRRIRSRLQGSPEARDRPVLDLTWDYPTQGEHQEPSAEAVLAEINGFDAEGKALSSYKELKADGSTSCGCWIYCGVFADRENKAARKKPYWEQDSYTAPEWAWAWPADRRILYTRASAEPDGVPWSERKRLVWWDAEKKKWTGVDVPDFDEEKAPDYRPSRGARGPEAIAGNHPFIMQADGRGWLYVPHGLEDGPLPTHYEPHESPFDNPLYSQRANPERQRYDRPENPYNPSGSEGGSGVYPFVATTYRLTEHHTAGGMSRSVPYLAEIQPAMFVEVDPELAELRGLHHGGWATIVTTRTAIEARVLVTDRVKPLTVRGRRVHQVGLPYHWGTKGLTTGDSANDLSSIVLDPNVHIQEVKAFTCEIRPGRRPRGPALVEFVDGLRAQALAEANGAPRQEPAEVRKT
jgi:formate dehydrogenase major subunit